MQFGKLGFEVVVFKTEAHVKVKGLETMQKALTTLVLQLMLDSLPKMWLKEIPLRLPFCLYMFLNIEFIMNHIVYGYNFILTAEEASDYERFIVSPRTVTPHRRRLLLHAHCLI